MISFLFVYPPKNRPETSFTANESSLGSNTTCYAESQPNNNKKGPSTSIPSIQTTTHSTQQPPLSGQTDTLLILNGKVLANVTLILTTNEIGDLFILCLFDGGFVVLWAGTHEFFLGEVDA